MTDEGVPPQLRGTWNYASGNPARGTFDNMRWLYGRSGNYEYAVTPSRHDGDPVTVKICTPGTPCSQDPVNSQCTDSDYTCLQAVVTNLTTRTLSRVDSHTGASYPSFFEIYPPSVIAAVQHPIYKPVYYKYVNRTGLSTSAVAEYQFKGASGNINTVDFMATLYPMMVPYASCNVQGPDAAHFSCTAHGSTNGAQHGVAGFALESK